MTQDYKELVEEEADLSSLLVEEEELRPILMEYLYEGMKVVEDIFSSDGKLLLIPKGDILTASALDRLKRYNSDSRHISVHVTTYNLLMRGRQAPPFVPLSTIEEITGYTRLNNAADDLLEQAQREGVVSVEQSRAVSDEIAERLRTVDPAQLFQCINSPKPVDEYLGRHSTNVALLNGFMGRWLGLPQQEIDELLLAGLVHDVGKTRIPAQILDAPRALTISEFEVMKMHPLYSVEMLRGDERFSEAVVLAARHHHERMNGSGYPDGINISQISLFARITAVSDIYDAMVSKHSYREATNPFLILSQLSGSRFSELDTKLIKLFIDNMPKELVGKRARMSDGTVGIIRFVMPNDLKHPLVEVRGELRKTDDSFYCQSIFFE